MSQATRQAEELVLGQVTPSSITGLRQFLTASHPPQADIARFCKGYSTSVSFSRIPDKYAGRFDKEVEQCRTDLAADLAQVTGDKKLSVEAAVVEYTLQIEQEHNVTLTKTAGGFPTFGFPKDTKPRDICRLAVLVCIRCWTECDIIVSVVFVVVVAIV